MAALGDSSVSTLPPYLSFTTPSFQLVRCFPLKRLHFPASPVATVVLFLTIWPMTCEWSCYGRPRGAPRSSLLPAALLVDGVAGTLAILSDHEDKAHHGTVECGSEEPLFLAPQSRHAGPSGSGLLSPTGEMSCCLVYPTPSVCCNQT